MSDVAAPALAPPQFSIGDRMQLARAQCGIKSTARMADLLAPILGKSVAASTISAWETGRNQPTRGGIRMENVITAWARVCTEEAARQGLPVVVSPGWLYTGSDSRATRSDKRGSAGQGMYLASANSSPKRPRHALTPLLNPVVAST